MGKLHIRKEPFSFAALSKSNGKTCFKSQVTPKAFEDGDEVVLNALYADLYAEFKNPSYKKYFSTLVVYSASWDIDFERWVYHVRYKRAVFLTVTEDQIRTVGKQTRIGEGIPRERCWQPKKHPSRWNSEQQPLILSTETTLKGGQMDRWKAGEADAILKERLAKRK